MEEIDNGICNVCFGPLRLGRLIERHIDSATGYDRIGHGGGDDDPSNYACRYQSRSGPCGGATPTGAYIPGCFQFDANNYNISPQQVCANVTAGGLHCAGTCCITSQYQNVTLTPGTC